MAALSQSQRVERRVVVAPSVENRRALDRIWLLVALALPLMIGNGGRVNYIDFWWSTAVGREIVTTGRFPGVEPLFYTPVVESFPWAQWLAHVLLYLVYVAGGLPGVLLLHGLIATLVGGLLYLAGRRVGADVSLAAGLAVVGSIFVSVGMAERPQLFAVAPFAAFALLLTSRRVSHLTIVGLPLLMVFWVNVHGSFVLGIGLVGLCWLDRAWQVVRTESGDAASSRPVRFALARLVTDRELRRRTLLGALTALATLASPLGYRSWAYAFAVQGNEVIRVMAVEWQPTSAREAYGWLLFAGLGAVALLGYWRRGRLSPGQTLAFGVFTILMLMAIRNGVWWSIVAVPFAARLALRAGCEPAGVGLVATPAEPTGCAPERSVREQALARSVADEAVEAAAEPARRSDRRLARLNGLLTALIVFLAVVTLPQLRPLQPNAVRPGVGAWLAVETPAGVADFLRSSDFSGNVFAEANWTTYLAEVVGNQRARFFLDCRYELHPTEVWDEYGRIAHGHASWQQSLDRYDVTWLVLDVKGSKDLVSVARDSAAWREVYTDEQGVVFRRATASSADGR